MCPEFELDLLFISIIPAYKERKGSVELTIHYIFIDFSIGNVEYHQLYKK